MALCRLRQHQHHRYREKAPGYGHQYSPADTTAKTPEDKSKRESPPKSATFDINGVNVVLNWGSPKVKGRVIWGETVPYGEVWRTGANEATTIEFNKNARVGGKEIPAGKYGLFTVPEKAMDRDFQHPSRPMGRLRIRKRKRPTAHHRQTRNGRHDRGTPSSNRKTARCIWFGKN